MESSKDRILELQKLITYHNEKYHNQDNPEISDYEYDKLSLELRNLEEKYPEFAKKSPTQKVGGSLKRELKKVAHDVKVLSLLDTFSKGEVYDMIGKISKDVLNPSFVVEKKIDGLSVLLRYENGVFTEGITRGDGVTGESVFESLLEIADVPRKIEDAPAYLQVRGEVYMSDEAFLRANEKQEELGKKLFANPRNCAAGTLRQLDPSIVRERGLNLFVFNLEISEGKEFKSHSESLEYLKNQGFKVSPDYVVCKTADEVWQTIQNIGKKRFNLPYGIDGAVVKLDNIADREILGSTSKAPRWAFCYKYPPEAKTTLIEDIIIQVGRTGRITPLAVLKPVNLAGSTVSRATLHNQDYIDLKDIRVGDTVLVQKAGDIIPEVVEVIINKRPQNSEKFNLPENCPVCSHKTEKEKDGAHLVCQNPDCTQKHVRGIIYFASKDAMNIEGMGKSTVETLINEGYIKDIANIYALEKFRDELIEKGIVGREKAVDNLLRAIENSKQNDIDRLIAGLGIRNLGKQSARVLSMNFGSLEDVIDAGFDRLIALPDFGETMANDILDFLSQEKNLKIIKKLEDAGVNMISKSQESIKDLRFVGLTFVITGTLPSFSRDEAADIVKSFGGKVSSSVSKKTNYVLFGEAAGSKLTKAQELGVKTITEDEFKELINE